MKKSIIFSGILQQYLIAFLFAGQMFAQGYGGVLTFQGLDHYALHSAGTRAAGGITIGVQQDIGSMFQNPATLTSIEAMNVSLGGMYWSSDIEQEQNYAPVRYYSNLSLLLEGLTAGIPDPDTSLVGFSPQDSVQRPYDQIGPDWSRSADNKIPLQLLLAVPASLGQVKIVTGIGAVKYSDLNHYYQHNNVLSPSILSQRPLPTLRPTDDNPLAVDWSQTIRSREGGINGYGMALAASVEKYNLSIGFSGLVLDGSSDDFEQQVSRGRLTFYSNAFRADSVHSIITKTGTSDFSGQEFTLSSIISGRYVSAGFSVKFPSTITRAYNMEIRTDTTGTVSVSTLAGKDKMELPWRGTIGLALTPGKNLTIGLEYEFHPYASASYIDTDGTESTPWLSSSLFRAGLVYQTASWLTLRGGMRGQAEVFEAEGNYIDDEPVVYTVYSAGLGLFYSNLRLDLTYEYSQMKYQDIWASAISKNSDQRHMIIGQISYEIPWIRLK
jgi:opacity protein-like surface antigen